MALILAVDDERRSVERIRYILGVIGCDVEVVPGAEEARRSLSARRPDLVLVAAELPESEEVLRSTSRRNGGPGSIALVAGDAAQARSIQLSADEVLSKPFGHDELRDLIERWIDAPEEPAGSTEVPVAEAGGLSANDIFADVVSAVENEVARVAAGGPDAITPDAAAPAAGTAAAAPEGEAPPVAEAVPEEKTSPPADAPGEAATDSAATDSPVDAPGEDSASTGAVDRPSPAADADPGRTDPGKKRQRRRSRIPARLDADVERRLQQTLSGVFDGPLTEGAKKTAPKQTAPKKQVSKEKAPTKEAPPKTPGATATKRSVAPSDEVGGDDKVDIEELLADTLAGLELPGAQPPSQPESETEGALPATSGDVSDVQVDPGPPDEAMADSETASGPVDSAAPATEGGEGVREESGVFDTGVFAAAEPDSEASEAESPSAADADPDAGEGRADLESFGPYLLEERIGTGGMAEVWKARRQGVQGFQKTVAIKRILPHLARDENFVTMFVDEAKLAAQLSHDNIAQIFDLGQLEDSYYIAMEFVEGNNLRSVLNAAEYLKRSVPLEVALLVARALADALAYAHKKQDFDGNDLDLVHRDVSPQNILLSYDGAIKLCDFGIAKAAEKSSLTKVGALKGKMQYMSPEQAWGKTVDQRTDIFSLGAVLFEMLAGRPAFLGESEIALLETVRECRVPELAELREGLPEGVLAIVRRATAKDPDDRFQSAADLADELRREVDALDPVPRQATVARYVQDLFWGDEWGEGPSDDAVRSDPVELPREEDLADAAAGRPERDWLPWVGAAVVLVVVVVMLALSLF